MYVEVSLKALRDRRTMAVAGGLGLSAIAVLGSLAYQAMGIDSRSMVADFPEAMQSMMGLAGAQVDYVISTTFGIMAPVVVLLVGISGGSAAIAGEERDGTAALLFAQPVTRRGVVSSKAAAAVVHVAIVGVLLLGGAVLASALVDVGTSVAHMAATTLLAVGFGVAFAMIALALSAATGSARSATGLSAVLAVAAYLLKSLLPLVEGWGDLAKVSPWYYYDGSDPLVNGLDPLHLAVLATIALVGFAVALASVDRRDLGSGSASLGFELPAVLERLGRLGSPRIAGMWSFAVSSRTSLMLIAGASFAAMGLAFGAMFPGIQSTLVDIVDQLPAGVSGFIGGADMSTGVGWINAEMLAITAPFALIGITTVTAAGSIANEIRHRRLVGLLALPVRRAAVVLTSAGAIAVAAVAIGIGGALGLALGSIVGDLGLSTANIAASMVQLAALGIAFGMLALALGTFTSSRTATAITCGVAFVAYFSHALLSLSDSLSGWGRLSPWYYYAANDPLSNGLSVGYVAVLVASSALALGAAVALFERRDISS